MEPLRHVRSVAVPMLLPNVDTDVMTPMRRLTGGAAHPLDHYAFEALRYLGGDGDTGEPDPAFPLNDPSFAGAQIMLTGPNFGCGSSRESAPMAIARLGFRVIVGSTFGDIFFSNCFQQGLLPIRLAPADVTALAADPGAVIEVDVVAQTIVAGGVRVDFELNPLRKACLLEGTDLVGLSLTYADDISAFEARHRDAQPWVFDVATVP